MIKHGKSVTLGRVRKGEGLGQPGGFRPDNITRGAMSVGEGRYKGIEKPSLVQADAVGSNRQLSDPKQKYTTNRYQREGLH